MTTQQFGNAPSILPTPVSKGVGLQIPRAWQPAYWTVKVTLAEEVIVAFAASVPVTVKV
jgi:hypothetical protein